MFKRVISKIKYIKFKRKVKSKFVIIKRNSFLSENSLVEHNIVISENCNIINTEIGYATYIGKGCYINSASIGRFCSIGKNVSVIRGKHPTSIFVSTHPAFYSINKQAGFTYVSENLYEEYNYVDKENKKSIVIGNDVWIGSNVLLMENITIGDGAIIACGSVVTKSVEPYTIVAGVPAIEKKKRFNDEEIEYLLKIKWWDKDEKWIKENASLFVNIDKFIKEVEE